MKKATKKQTEIQSEIEEPVINLTEPSQETIDSNETEQPTEPTEPTEQPTEPTEPTEQQVASETQKKKRGRPKKENSTSEKSAQQDSKNIENDIFANDKEFEQHKSEQQNKETEEQTKQKTIFNISGEMLLGAIDFTAPLFITYVGGFIEPKLKSVPASQFMLAEEERKTLLPAAEAVAKENVKLSPLEMLLGGLLIVYTGKIYQAINEVRK
jgi:type IV secretory pathway VirB10-like protein